MIYKRSLIVLSVAKHPASAYKTFNIQSTKRGSKTLMSKKAKVVVIVSFIIFRPLKV